LDGGCGFEIIHLIISSLRRVVEFDEYLSFSQNELNSVVDFLIQNNLLQIIDNYKNYFAHNNDIFLQLESLENRVRKIEKFHDIDQ
jgi:hypothetical protein